MKMLLWVLALAALATHLGAAKTIRQSAAAPLAKAEYRVIHDWPVLPDNTIFGEVSSVAVDALGNVFALERGGRKWPESDVLDQAPIVGPTVFVFHGRTGNPIVQWGTDPLIVQAST